MKVKEQVVRLKQDIEFKELEKYGYQYDSEKFIKPCYLKDIASFTYYVDLEDRIFRFVCDYDYDYVWGFDDLLEDLWEANIIEEIEIERDWCKMKN